jgi:hypothetical protein
VCLGNVSGHFVQTVATLGRLLDRVFSEVDECAARSGYGLWPCCVWGARLPAWSICVNGGSQLLCEVHGVHIGVYMWCVGVLTRRGITWLSGLV